MAPSIKLDPKQDVQAQGVSVAGVRIKPSPMNEFARQVVPGLLKMEIAPKAGDDPGAAAVIKLTDQFNAEMAAAAESGELTQGFAASRLQATKGQLNKELFAAGIPIDKYSHYRGALNDGIATSQHIQEKQKGDFTVVYNAYTNKTKVDTSMIDDEARARALEDALVNISPVLLEQSKNVDDPEAFLKPEALRVAEEQYQMRALNQRLATIKAENELAAEGEKGQLRKMEPIQRELNLVKRQDFDKLVDNLANQVSAQKITPEQAEEAIDAWYGNLSTLPELYEFGIDADKFLSEFQRVREAAVRRVNNRDPLKELTRESLIEEEIWKHWKFGRLNAMPDFMKHDMVVSETVRNLVFTNIYREQMGQGEIPSLTYGSLAANIEKRVSEWAVGPYSGALDETPDMAALTGSQTKQAAAKVYKAFLAVEKGDESSPDYISVDNLLLMYNQLKALPSYGALPPEGQKLLENAANRMYIVFDKDPRVQKLLDTFIKEKK